MAKRVDPECHNTHYTQDDHRIDCEKSTVISREPNYYKKRVKEALFIKKFHNMNQDHGLAVSPIWNIDF